MKMSIHALEYVSFLHPFELACAFPPKNHLNGAMTTIADLSVHGLDRANKLFVPTMRDAVRLIVATNYERGNGRGHGNRARRRQERRAA
jgi:hypothetical protein